MSHPTQHRGNGCATRMTRQRCMTTQHHEQRHGPTPSAHPTQPVSHTGVCCQFAARRQPRLQAATTPGNSGASPAPPPHRRIGQKPPTPRKSTWCRTGDILPQQQCQRDRVPSPTRSIGGIARALHCCAASDKRPNAAHNRTASNRQCVLIVTQHRRTNDARSHTAARRPLRPHLLAASNPARCIKMVRACNDATPLPPTSDRSAVLPMPPTPTISPHRA